MNTSPLTDGELADRIVDAVRYSLLSTGAVVSDQMESAVANAVLVAVLPELNRLRAELAVARDRAPFTCDASTTTGLGAVGPCVLRLGHDGPIHEDRAGARWWPTISFSDRTVEA